MNGDGKKEKLGARIENILNSVRIPTLDSRFRVLLVWFLLGFALIGLTACAGRTLSGGPVYQSPAIDGVFSPCEVVRTKTINVGGLELDEFSIFLYLPRASDEQGCDSIASQNRPLVLIYPALDTFAGNDSSDYQQLGLRLASHGFVVASVGRNIQLSQVIEFVDSEIGGFLNNDVVLIGHSAGGDLMVKRRGQPAALGRSVRAMVLMAPKVVNILNHDYSLSGVDAFLGLHWVRDNDSATWGASNPETGGLRRSVFRIYDRAGVDFTNPDSLSLTKHFVFLNYSEHLNQDKNGVLTYITAFLRRYVMDDLLQDQHLKLMSPPAQLASADQPVSQQHEEPDRVLLASFEESGALGNPAVFDGLVREGVRFEPSPNGIIFAFSDPFSPHDLGVLRFNFEALTQDEHSVTVLLDAPVPVNGMNYLSFRISQEYHSDTAPSGGIIDFDIIIHSSAVEHRVLSEDYQRLRFPVIALVSLTQTGEEVDATKNALRTYMIPLVDFSLTDPENIQGVTFDFTRSGEVPGRKTFIALDQVQLTK